MAKRESAAESSKKPRRKPPRPSDETIEKGRQNLARGRAIRDKQIAKARAEGRETAGKRWARLLDGSLTVRDLDDDEIERMRVRGADGGFTGKRQPMPSHIAQQMRNELIRRSQDIMLTGIAAAARRMINIVDSDDVKDADAIRAAQVLFDRVMGKAPETITVRGETDWEALLRGMSGAPEVEREELAD